jgi:hemerythrin
MMSLIWTKQLSVGNATLDSEHKNLIGMIDTIEYVIHARDSFALLHLFNRFKECAHIHFTNEEQFAREIQFPFAEHNLSHRYFYQELQHTIGELEIRFGSWVEYVWDYYDQFLREWLVEHIVKEDMLMKPLLQTYPYGFKPAGLHGELPDLQAYGYDGE